MNTQELHELAKKVAPLIGYEYLDVENRNDGVTRFPEGGLNRYARITHPTIGQGSLWIEEGRTAGRVVVAVAWPRGDEAQGWQIFTVNQMYRKPEETKISEISVSASKSPEQIAKDIKRRLLADAEALYQEAYSTMIGDRNWKSARVNAIIEIADVVGKTPGHGVRENDLRGHFYFNNVEGQVEVRSASNIKIEYDARNVEQAKKIIEFLKTLQEVK